CLVFIAFVAPNLLFLGVFAYWPLIQNVGLSFVDWDMISPDRQFVGLDNWVSVLTEPRFWQIVANTVVFTAGSVGFTLVIGLALALLLNQALIGRTAGRTVLFIPTVLSGAAVAVVWYFVFDPNWGLIRIFLAAVNLPSPHWLIDQHWAMVAVVMVYVWKNV